LNKTKAKAKAEARRVKTRTKTTENGLKRDSISELYNSEL